MPVVSLVCRHGRRRQRVGGTVFVAVPRLAEPKAEVALCKMVVGILRMLARRGVLIREARLELHS